MVTDLTKIFLSVQLDEMDQVDKDQKRQSMLFLLSPSAKGGQQNLFINSV